MKVAIGGQEITCTVNEAARSTPSPATRSWAHGGHRDPHQGGLSDHLYRQHRRSGGRGLPQRSRRSGLHFTLTKDADYEYTVSAKYTESGATVPVTDNGDGTYTIAGKYITGDDISITVSKSPRWISSTSASMST